MARNATLGTLKTMIREQADMVSSSFITEAELNRYVNNSCAELYGLLVRAYGEDYYMTETSVVVPANSESVSLPSGFFKLLQVEIRPPSQRPILLRQYMLRDKHNYVVGSGNYNFRYRIMGSKIYLDQTTKNALTLHMFVVPAFTDMVNDSDSFDFVNGWEDYVIADVCMKVLAKQQDDLSYYIGKKTEQLDRINKEKMARNLSEPQEMIGYSDWDDEWGY